MEHTDFIKSCQDGDVEQIDWFLQQPNASEIINQRDMSGRTGLAHACAEGHLQVVKILQSDPATDPNIEDTEGNTALILAAQAGYADTVHQLIHGFPNLEVDRANKLRFTALMKAAIQGNIRCAKLLLMAGADPLRTDCSRHYCALQWAELVGREECVQEIAKFMEEGSTSDCDPSALIKQVRCGRVKGKTVDERPPVVKKHKTKSAKLQEILGQTNSLDELTKVLTKVVAPDLNVAAKPIRPLVVPKLEITKCAID